MSHNITTNSKFKLKTSTSLTSSLQRIFMFQMTPRYRETVLKFIVWLFYDSPI